MLKKIFSKQYQLVIFLSIFFISIAVRFYGLGKVPASLNRDEASLAYTAYSILKTGHEEHGVYWPINIESFGDWKLPGYVYTLIPFIGVFGLEDWVVRLPSALSGIGVSVLSFVLVNLLLKNKSKDEELVFSSEKNTNISLLVFFIVSISPWAVHLSHVAYEANLAMFFFLGGLVSYFWAKAGKYWLYPFAVLFFGLTLFIYHSYQVFTPLVGLYLFFSKKTDLLKTWKKSTSSKKSLSISALLVILFGLAILLSGTKGANKIKFSGLSIFGSESYELIQLQQRRMFSDMNSLQAKLYANKIVHPIFQLQNNVLSLFSSEFLFLKGGSNGSHNISGIGNFYPIMSLFLIIGFLSFYKEKKPWQKFIFTWVLLAMVAPIITFEANHTTRFSPGFIPISIIMAYGLWWFLDNLKNKQTAKWLKILMSGVLLWGIYTVFHFFLTYFTLFPQQDVDGWAWQYKKIAFQASSVADDYEMIFIPGESASPYIFFLYYLKVDPSTLNNNLEYYPPTEEGFRHVKRFEKYYFQDIDWDNDFILNKKVLNIVLANEFPQHKKDNSSYKKEFAFKNEHSKYSYEFWSYNP